MAPFDITVAFQPLLALIFGILILIMPRLLNYLVAIYLIVIGGTGLLPQLTM
jgi:ABC-type arginine/histidine transport system permease subunit